MSFVGPLDQGGRDVRAAGPDVEQGELNLMRRPVRSIAAALSATPAGATD